MYHKDKMFLSKTPVQVKQALPRGPLADFLSQSHSSGANAVGEWGEHLLKVGRGGLSAEGNAEIHSIWPMLWLRKKELINNTVCPASYS